MGRDSALTYGTNTSAPAWPRCLVFPHLSHTVIDIPPQPPPITSDGQFPLKRGQIYCATECAEGFLGRRVHTAEMESRKEGNWDKLGSCNPFRDH